MGHILCCVRNPRGPRTSYLLFCYEFKKDNDPVECVLHESIMIYDEIDDISSHKRVYKCPEFGCKNTITINV